MGAIARWVAAWSLAAALAVAGGTVARAQTGSPSCAVCQGCAEIVRYATASARRLRHRAAEARRGRRNDVARTLTRRARTLDERRARAAADLRTCRRTRCGPEGRPGGAFLQCVIRPDLTGRWRSTALRCRSGGRAQVIRVRDERPSYRLRVTVENCPRPGAVLFDAVVGPTRYFLSSTARSRAGRLVYRREDLVIVDANRMRLRGAGRKRAVRYARLPVADLGGTWRILRPGHLAGSLLRIEQNGAAIRARHLRPSLGAERFYDYRAGQRAFRGALKGRMVSGRIRSRFPLRLGRRCPDKLVRPVAFTLRVSRDAKRLVGRYRRARLTTRACAVSELATWNTFELERVPPR